MSSQKNIRRSLNRVVFLFPSLPGISRNACATTGMNVVFAFRVGLVLFLGVLLTLDTLGAVLVEFAVLFLDLLLTLLRFAAAASTRRLLEKGL